MPAGGKAVDVHNDRIADLDGPGCCRTPRLPPKADQRMQDLMDRNNNGAFTPEQLEQLETLVERSETIAIVRAEALHLLKRSPE